MVSGTVIKGKKGLEVAAGVGVSQDFQAIAQIASRQKWLDETQLLREQMAGVATKRMSSTDLEHITHLLTEDAKKNHS